MATQFEKNLRQSFSFVKRDLIAVNEELATLKTRIQHLSMNNATLLAEMENMRREIASLGKKKKK